MDAKIGFIGLTPESSRDPDLQLLGSNQENEYSHYFRLVRYSNGRNMSGRQKLQILNAIQQKQINFSFLIFFFFPIRIPDARYPYFPPFQSRPFTVYFYCLK